MNRFIALILAVLLLTGCAAGQPIHPDSVDGPTEISLAPQITTEPSSAPSPTETSEVILPADDALVDAAEWIPGLYVDLRYAGQNNFTGQAIYSFTAAQLRFGTVKKLQAVQQELSACGYSLLIWDACRPVSAQFRLWEVCPDPNYVANPNLGYSTHSRGNTVDLTLVNTDGSPVVMPTDFDDFTAMADRDYSDCSAEAAANAIMLQTVMERWGFTGYTAEWWHFADTDSYDVVEAF